MTESLWEAYLHKRVKEVRAATIEECARVAQAWAQADPEFRDCWPKDSVAAAIRALKERE